MSNISELNLKRLTTQVGFPITGYYSNDGGDTFAVNFRNAEGDIETKIINKQDISEGFKVNKATVGVGDNPTYSDAYKAFSDKYGLGLVEGVDYLKNDNPLIIQNIAIITLVINPNSILYTGSVTMTVYLNSNIKKFTEAASKVGVALRSSFCKSMLALARPIDPKATAFVGNQITKDTVKALKDRFANHAFFDGMPWDDLAGGTIINYQGWSKAEGDMVIKVYLRGVSDKLYSFSVIPLNDQDRPTQN